MEWRSERAAAFVQLTRIPHASRPPPSPDSCSMSGRAHPDGIRDRMTPRALDVATTVNGEVVRLQLAPEVLLLDMLRDELGLLGAKRSCDVEVCGACTVLLDGLPVSACTTLALE